MPLTFTVARSVPQAPKEVWAVLGAFGTEHHWSSALEHTERDTEGVDVGTARHCTLPEPMMGRTEVEETLVEYEEGASLAYRLQGEAGPFASAGSRWRIRPGDDGGTVVEVQGRFQPKNALVRWLVWPFARLYLRRLARKGLDELAAYLDEGAPGHGG